MTSVQYLESALKDLFQKFPSGNIRYEYRPNRKSHIIEITPIDLYRNDLYKLAELTLEEEFESRYPGENIVFVSTESLNKITNPTLELLGEKNITVCVFVDQEEIYPICADNTNLQYAGENNFALAA